MGKARILLLTEDVFPKCARKEKALMRGLWKLILKLNRKLKPCGAGDGIRTRDLKLGKLVLYQLSYTRVAA